LVLYVEDFILIGSFENLIAWCQKNFASGYDTKEIGLMHYFLGL
jgi:hypothetical protein